MPDILCFIVLQSVRLEETFFWVAAIKNVMPRPHTVRAQKKRSACDAGLAKEILESDVPLEVGVSTSPSTRGEMRRHAIALLDVGQYLRAERIVKALHALGDVHAVDAVVLGRAAEHRGDLKFAQVMRRAFTTWATESKIHSESKTPSYSER